MGKFMGKEYFILDAHNNVMPEWVITIWDRIAEPPRQTLEDLIKRMNECKIDIAVINPVATFHDKETYKAVNNYISECVRKFPDRLIGFCSVNPLHGEFAIEELRRCVKELGLKGVGELIPYGQGHYLVDSEIMDPLMEELARLKVPINIHSDFREKCCTPYQIALLADRFPDVTIIMAHMGMDPDVIHWVPRIVKRYENIILNTSLAPPIPESVFKIPVDVLGPERVVFGSDSPTVSPEAQLKILEVAVTRYGLSEEAVRMILGENMARILEISPKILVK